MLMFLWKKPNDYCLAAIAETIDEARAMMAKKIGELASRDEYYKGYYDDVVTTEPVNLGEIPVDENGKERLLDFITANQKHWTSIGQKYHLQMAIRHVDGELKTI